MELVKIDEFNKNLDSKSKVQRVAIEQIIDSIGCSDDVKIYFKQKYGLGTSVYKDMQETIVTGDTDKIIDGRITVAETNSKIESKDLITNLSKNKAIGLRVKGNHWGYIEGKYGSSDVSIKGKQNEKDKEYKNDDNIFDFKDVLHSQQAQEYEAKMNDVFSLLSSVYGLEQDQKGLNSGDVNIDDINSFFEVHDRKQLAYAKKTLIRDLLGHIDDMIDILLGDMTQQTLPIHSMSEEELQKMLMDDTYASKHVHQLDDNEKQRIGNIDQQIKYLREFRTTVGKELNK